MRKSEREHGSLSQRDIGTPAAKPTLTQVRPEVVDDFIRNFLIKVGMSRTLDNFNSEWYDLQQKGKLAEVYTDTVPDIYVRNQDLDERVVALQQQLDKMRIITEKAQGTWDKFRKESDFHRMHHRRVVQEKAKSTTDLQRLRKHYLSYEPTLKDLQKKYEVAMKEKMLTRLERDRIKARVHTWRRKCSSSRPPQKADGQAKHQRAPASHARSAARTQPAPPADSGSIGIASLTFDPPGIERCSSCGARSRATSTPCCAAFHPS